MTRRSARWSDLGLRVISAAVLAPVALTCTWIGGTPFTALVCLIAIGLAYEWTGLCGERSSVAAALIFVVLPLSVVVTVRDSAGHALILLAAGMAGATLFARGLSLSRPLAFGIPWLGLGAVALVWLRQPAAGGGANVIVLLLVVWASDIGAYIAGRSIGGPKLAPSISPGKTWSGAVGGLVAAACVGCVAAAILGDTGLGDTGLGDTGLGDTATLWRPGVVRSTVFAILIGLTSQVGDLFESQVKRHFGVKDSGTLIPGHGGLLDRLDAVLTAAPTAALLALVLGRGVVLWE